MMEYHGVRATPEERELIEKAAMELFDKRFTVNGQVPGKSWDYIGGPVKDTWRQYARSTLESFISDRAKLREALEEIADAHWPSVNGDDPVVRIKGFARSLLNTTKDTGNV